MTNFFKDKLALQTIAMDPAWKKEGKGPVIETYNRVGGLIEVICEIIGIDKLDALAILMAESSGSGFQNWRCVIRFEVHWFWKLWGKQNPAEFDEHFKPRASWKNHRYKATIGTWGKFHNNQDTEWEVFNFACGLDKEAACQSTSFGGPQIMGFNHARCGYGTAVDLFNAFKESERWHILGLFDYFQTDPKIMKALKAGDFHTVARRYNGSGQAGAYAAIIRKHRNAAKKVMGE